MVKQVDTDVAMRVGPYPSREAPDGQQARWGAVFADITMGQLAKPM